MSLSPESIAKLKPTPPPCVIKMEATPKDAELIDRIIRRVKQEMVTFSVSLLALEMDITACHLNGNPLDLARLVVAPRHDFIHDVFGIRKYIDRKTGKLTNPFSPRYSK